MTDKPKPPGRARKSQKNDSRDKVIQSKDKEEIYSILKQEPALKLSRSEIVQILGNVLSEKSNFAKQKSVSDSERIEKMYCKLLKDLFVQSLQFAESSFEESLNQLDKYLGEFKISRYEFMVNSLYALMNESEVVINKVNTDGVFKTFGLDERNFTEKQIQEINRILNKANRDKDALHLTTQKFESKWSNAGKNFSGEETGVWLVPKVRPIEWRQAKAILERLKEGKKEDEEYYIKIDRKEYGLNRSFYFVHARQMDGTFRDQFVALSRGKKLQDSDGVLGFGGIGVAKLGVTEDGSKYVYKVSNAKYDENDISIEERKELNELIGCVNFTERGARNTRWIGDDANAKLGSLRDKNRELKPLFDGTELLILLNQAGLSEKQRLQIALMIGEDLKRRFHAHDFLHRDIKPGNIIVQLDRTGEVIAARLIDEGLALKMQAIPLEGSTEFVMAKVASTAGTEGYLRQHDWQNTSEKRAHTTEDDVLAYMLMLGAVNKLLPQQSSASEDTAALLAYDQLVQLCYKPDLLDINLNPHPYTLAVNDGEFKLQSNQDASNKTITYALNDIIKILRDRLAELDKPKPIITMPRDSQAGRPSGAQQPTANNSSRHSHKL